VSYRTTAHPAGSRSTLRPCWSPASTRRGSRRSRTSGSRTSTSRGTSTRWPDVARSERGISTLHEATDGDPSRSRAWNLYMRPYGAEQELLLALRTQGAVGDAGALPCARRATVRRRRSRRREARRGHRRARSSCPHLILLMAAYRLTEREQDVTRLVLRGDSTAHIADRLCICSHPETGVSGPNPLTPVARLSASN